MRFGQRSEHGFVLPSVLAYIAAFAFILLGAAAALDRNQDIVVGLDHSNLLENTLDRSEAIALYLFLTSPGVPGGLDTSRKGEPARDDLLKSAENVVLGTSRFDITEDDGDAQLWSAAGGIVVTSNTAPKTWIVYHDATGLISLQTVDARVFTKLMDRFQVPETESGQMYAALRDFQDEDNLRRPLGAERADYRLRKLAPPSNAPLRTPAELKAVMGWEDFQALNSVDFLRMVTVSTALSIPRRFSPEAVQELLDQVDLGTASDGDPLLFAAQNSLLPSNKARFSIIAEDELSSSYRVRFIEIQRQPNSVARPYSRTLITEQVVSSIPEEWLIHEDHEVFTFGQP